MSTLAERLVAVHQALEHAGVEHAFGGAIALAYCTAEPRGTRDLDINVFAPPEEAGRVLNVLPEGVAVSDADVAAAARDGQVRVWWDDTPLDLFFEVHAFHRHVASQVRTVAFEGTRIPVLDCNALTVFKALFNRTRHWADIESMLDAGAADVSEALVWVRELLGENAPASKRLSQLVGRHADHGDAQSS